MKDGIQQQNKVYLLTELQRIEIIKVLDELPLPGKYHRQLTNFFEKLQPVERPESEN